MAEPLRSEAGGASLRVGVVGAGWMGQTHGQAWAGHAARACVVAVTDVSEPRAQGPLRARLRGPGTGLS